MAGKKQETHSRTSQRLCFGRLMFFHSFCCFEDGVWVALEPRHDLLLRFVQVEHLNLKNAKPSQTGVTDCATEGPRMRMSSKGFGLRAPTIARRTAMTYFDNLAYNPQFGQFGPQQQGGWGALGSQGGLGLGQAAYGQQYGQYGGQQPFGAFGYSPGWGQPMGWGQQWGGQQRQLSQQDVNEVVRQLVPALPQMLAQAQNPFGGIGY